MGFDDNHPCVFVLSTGRTGTETLAALSSLAQNVLAYHEPDPRLYGLSKLAYENAADTSAKKAFHEALRLGRNHLWQYSMDCGKGYVETSPQVTFLAPFILDLIPNARFIHLVRDPRDVVRSGMRRKWFDGNAADKTRIVPLADSGAFDEWERFSPFQKNLWLWAETNRWIQKFLLTLPPKSALVLRSEDMFSPGTDVFEKLFGFIGSPLPPAKKVERLLGRKLNAQKTGEFPGSSLWTESMKNDLALIAGDTAQALGYSLSQDS